MECASYLCFLCPRKKSFLSLLIELLMPKKDPIKKSFGLPSCSNPFSRAARASPSHCSRVSAQKFKPWTLVSGACILRTAAYITATVAARALHAFPLCATPYGVRVLGLPCGGSAAAPLPHNNRSIGHTLQTPAGLRSYPSWCCTPACNLLAGGSTVLHYGVRVRRLTLWWFTLAPLPHVEGGLGLRRVHCTRSLYARQNATCRGPQAPARLRAYASDASGA